MSPEFVCVVAFVIIGAVICSMLYQQRDQRREGFTNWQDTVAYGKSVANPLAVTTDITRPNFAATADPAEIAAVNAKIADATRTPVMLPGPGDGSVQSNTGLGLYSAKPSYQIPQNSKALANAKRCAEVTNCGMLADPRYVDCGMCIKGGTDYQALRPGTYAGGLYVDPADSANAKAGGTPLLPTLGQCPAINGNQMFQTVAAPCVKETNRQICRDVPGFTAPNASKCALAYGSNQFVYQDPTTPNKTTASFYFATPKGVVTTVTIKDQSGNQLGASTASGSDAEVVLSDIAEGTPVRITVQQDKPYSNEGETHFGIAAQWTDTGRNYKIEFDKTLTGVVVGGTTGGTTGGNTMNDSRQIRKFGSLGSSIQMSPASTNVMPSAYWVWGIGGNTVTFASFVPGTFAATTYSEDAGLQRASPLIRNATTAAQIKIGPCNQPNQTAGNYSPECLSDLFVSSGGDLFEGKLPKTGLNTLNEKGTSDQISKYLGNLYSVATTGKDMRGAVASMPVINAASEAMFGFSLGNSCEVAVTNSDGSVGLSPAAAPLTNDCLQYLWNNTGNDRDRGDEDASRKTNLGNTYVSIRDRYSGLRSGEAGNKEAYPFQACQASGTEAPVNANGSPNFNAINDVNNLSVAQVQDYYDRIFQTANYTVGNGTDAAATLQAKALRQCYGVTKAPNPT